MFEHPESVGRVVREQFEERSRQGVAAQSVRRELGLEPRWRRNTAAVLRSVADRLDRTAGPVPVPATTRARGR